MKLEQKRTTVSASQPPQRQADTHLFGRWLLMARVGWIALTLLVVTLSAIALPRYDALAQSVCQSGAACLLIQLRPDDLLTLQQLGLSPGFLAAYQVGWAVGTLLVYLALAALLFWHRSRDRMALFCAYMLVLFGGATYTQLFDFGLRSLSPAWYWLVGGLEVLGQIGFPIFFLLFPSGRFVPRWTRWGIPAIVLLETQYVLFNDLLYSQPDARTGLSFVALILSLVGVQVYRYRRVSTFSERQQTKWVVYGFSFAIVGLALFIIGGDLFLTPEQRLQGQVGNVLLVGTYNSALLLLIPISIAIALLRSHLWDIDLIIKRTLEYGALTASVVGIYVLVVGYLGTLFRTGGNLLISLVATGLVAVLFQPLRGWLQRGVNRLFYGQRDEPYTVVSRLSQRLEATLAPDAVLPAVVETVAQALKLPYAALVLKEGEQSSTAASYGTPTGDALKLPLIYQAETLGDLLLAPRSPGEAWTPADRRLLDELARHAGAAAHAVRLTAELQRSNTHLLSARERLVTAREEERRRLRRDLHDGLGPTLAALTLKIGAARKLLWRDQQHADMLLLELNHDIETTVKDIRRLVYNLRPPALDDLGLIGAIRESAAQSASQNGMDSAPGLEISIEAPERLPPLSAAVEVAAYRIAEEALTNVARHAQARSCRVRLWCDEALWLEVADDGVGLAAGHHSGVGLLSMRERAAELGGSCLIEPVEAGGTRVLASLPIAKEG